MKATICFTHFRSCSLANLRAALYSVRQQDFSGVKELIVLDNDTTDSVEDMQGVLDELQFPIPVHLRGWKHGYKNRTHAWSTNNVVELATTPWVIFTRADYLLTFDAVQKFMSVVRSKPDGWDGFVTGHVYHLGVDIHRCELVPWHSLGTGILRNFPGVENDYTCIDAGVWMLPRASFFAVGGLDESLTAWGHAQTHFQHKLFLRGTEFVRIPEVLYFHPGHGGDKDIELAHQQLAALGVSLKDMWARYHGPSPY